jgi:hypothetical protein
MTVELNLMGFNPIIGVYQLCGLGKITGYESGPLERQNQ